MKKMGLPKVGMITFSDAREHEYKVLYEEKTAARIKRTVEYLLTMRWSCIPLIPWHVLPRILTVRQMSLRRRGWKYLLPISLAGPGPTEWSGEC